MREVHEAGDAAGANDSNKLKEKSDPGAVEETLTPEPSSKDQ